MSDKVAATPFHSITAPVYFNDSVHKSLKCMCNSTLRDNKYLLEFSKSCHESISQNDSFKFNKNK